MGLLVPRGGLLARNVPGNVRWTGHGLGHTRRPIMDLNREEASQMFGAPDTHDRPGLGPYIPAEDGIPGFEEGGILFV